MRMRQSEWIHSNGSKKCPCERTDASETKKKKKAMLTCTKQTFLHIVKIFRTKNQHDFTFKVWTCQLGTFHHVKTHSNQRVRPLELVGQDLLQEAAVGWERSGEVLQFGQRLLQAWRTNGAFVTNVIVLCVCVCEIVWRLSPERWWRPLWCCDVTAADLPPADAGTRRSHADTERTTDRHSTRSTKHYMSSFTGHTKICFKVTNPAWLTELQI